MRALQVAADWLRSHPMAWLALALMVLVAPSMLAGPSRKYLVLDAEPVASGTVQVYFDQGSGLSENLSATARMPARKSAIVRLPFPYGETQAVRIDPPAGGMLLRQLTVRDEHDRLIEVLPLAALRPLAGVALKTAQDGMSIAVAPGHPDPQLGLRLQASVHSSGTFAGAYGPVLVLLLVALLPAAWAARTSTRTQLLLSACCGGALLLSVAMALLSTTAQSVNPDEALHWADATFFISHWLPPRLDDPALLPSLTASPYGISYLFKWNIGYLLAGKLGHVLTAWGIEPRLGFRLFNLGLLVAAMAALARFLPKTMAPAVLLLTPQLWYVFSYFNGEGVPLAMSLIAMAIVASPRQDVQRFVATRTVGGGVALFALAMAALLLSKQNYLPVVLCCLGWVAVTTLQLRTMGALACLVLVGLGVLVAEAGKTGLLRTTPGLLPALALLTLAALAVLGMWLHGLVRDREPRIRLLRFGVLIAVIGALAAPWILVDAARNGMGATKQAVAMQLRERYAAPAFRPSALAKPATGPGSGFMLAAKGVKAGTLLDVPYDWQKVSFRSFFGAYGYMQFFGANAAYLAAGALFAAFLLVSLLATWRERRLVPAGAVLSIGLIAILVGASFLHSWAYDFQPQGRYLLGGLAMALPLLVAEGRVHRGYRMVQWWLALCLFALACHSFITVGLLHV